MINYNHHQYGGILSPDSDSKQGAKKGGHHYQTPEIMVIMTMMIIIYWFPSKGRVPNQNVDSEGTECWFWRHRMLFLKAYPLCMFIKCTNKMGRLRRMLILKTSPDQQMVSIRRPETTNCTVTEHHPHQQMCWSTKWVGHPDCSFWHPFTFLVTPTSTKWATGPICCPGKAIDGMQRLQMTSLKNWE